MVKLSVLLCFFVAFATAVNCATHHNAQAPAPAPAVDCSSLIYDMADCLSYVTNGSHDTKPQGSCCSGLKTVLKTDAECVCEAFKASPSLGIVLNITKALTLPAACGVSAPSNSNCGLSLTPGPAPAHPPKASAPGKSPPQKPSPSPAPLPPAPVVTPAPAPSAPTVSGNTGNAPAQAPAGSGASASVAISFVALIASLVVASCSYF